jgi:hypothetical protein
MGDLRMLFAEDKDKVSTKEMHVHLCSILGDHFTSV